MRATRDITIGIAVLCSLLVGCERRVRYQTAFLEQDPKQSMPAQDFVKPGDSVWVFGEKSGYARVFLEDGRAGFVWEDALE